MSYRESEKLHFRVVDGDIWERPVDAIVVPHLPGDEVLPRITARIYAAAGYDKMMTAYQDAKQESIKKMGRRFGGNVSISDKEVPIVAVTPGFGLAAKHAIHISIHAEEWQDEQTIDERCQQVRKISECYDRVANCAISLGVKSIALPLLGTCALGFPEEVSRREAEHAFYSFIQHANQRRAPENKIEMRITFVIPNDKKAQAPKTPKPVVFVPANKENFKYHKVFDSYREIFNQKIEDSKLSEDAFCRQRCYKFLEKIDNCAEFARSHGFQPSDFTHLVKRVNNQEGGSIPKKKRVITIAIGVFAMGLTDSNYEYYEFIKCSGLLHRLGFDYPADNLDYQVETIIRSGIKDFEQINKELCKINPDFDLTKPLRNNKPKSKTKREMIK